jgi:hypothetical protein
MKVRTASMKDSGDEGESKWKRPGFKAVLLVLSVLGSLFLAEIGLRVFYREHFFIYQDEKSLLYRYDDALGWFPLPNARERFLASRVFSVANNSQGFRAPEHVPSGKPGIAFIGDSFVWGYDVEAEERFTDKLQAKHPEWSVYNLGVSGYGTDQEYLLLQRFFDEYKPRVVFLLYCVETDHDDNSSNIRYGGYYKPYCTVAGNRLELHGVPVPRSERVFFAEHELLGRSCLVQLILRAYFKLKSPAKLQNPDPTGAIISDLNKYVKMKGAVLVVGLTLRNPRLEEFLDYLKIPFLDLNTPLRYPGYGAHWTPDGHTFVCEKIDEFLTKGGYLGNSSGLSAPAN